MTAAKRRIEAEANEFGDFRRARPSAPDGLRAEAAKARRFVNNRAARIAEARAEIEVRVAAARDTLRRLPPERERGWLRGVGSSWPAVLREFADMVGNIEEARRRTRPSPARPDAKAISNLEAVLGWALWLEPETRAVFMARLAGFSFRDIAEKARIGRTTVARRYAEAVGAIVARVGVDEILAEPMK